MTNLWMSSLKAKFPTGFKAFALSLGMLALAGCEELKSETAIQPLRPLDVSRSSVTVSNSSNAEVALAQTVTVRMADKRGAGINGIQPVITLVDGGGVQGTEITVGTAFNTSVRVIDRAGKPITTGAAAGSPITIALTSP
ncbi:MAG: hypothetical protein EOP11_24065, partial [Proteobacteria bacterium]